MNLIISILYSLAFLSLLVGGYFYLGYRGKKREWKQQLSKMYPEEKRKSYISVLGDRFDESENSDKLKAKLLNANVKLLPSEYIGVLVIGYMTLAVMLYSIFNISLNISILVPFILVAVAHYLLFFIRKNSYQKRFNGQLSEICRLLGNASRSGMTINQGIELIAREVPAPAGDEFRRIASELRLGVNLEDALRSVQKRNDSRDFNLFIATILIQKKTGGNLSKTLDTMANTLESRKVLAQQIQTMTSEQKYISYIVPALPIFLLLMMNNVMEGFTDPLWSGPGLIILILFLGALLLSFIIIRKVTDIEV